MSHSAHSLDRVLRSLLTVVCVLLALAGVGVLIYYFYSAAVLLGAVLIVTYLLLGPVNGMEWGIDRLFRQLRRLPWYPSLVRRTPAVSPRILAVVVVYAAFFFALVVGTVRFLPLLRSQVGEMGAKVGAQLLDVSDGAMDWADRTIGVGTVRNLFARDINRAEQRGELKTHMPQGKPVTREERQVIQQSVLENVVLQAEQALASAVPGFIAVVGGTVQGFVYFLSALLLTFYFLIDGARLKKDALRLIPRHGRFTVNYLLESFHQVMFAFIKGQVLLGLLTGFYMFIVYSVFQVPYAFLLGCIFAVAELLPVVGTWIGIGVGLTVILLSMEPSTALWVWLCSYGYQTIKDNILAPKVVGDVMGLHPMVIILALLICAKVAGLVGVLMAVPLAAALNVVIQLLLQKDAEQKTAQRNGGADVNG